VHVSFNKKWCDTFYRKTISNQAIFLLVLLFEMSGSNSNTGKPVSNRRWEKPANHQHHAVETPNLTPIQQVSKFINGLIIS
jgi:hypothetical protein